MMGCGRECWLLILNINLLSINRLDTVDLIEKIILKEVMYLSAEGAEVSRKREKPVQRPK